MAKSRQRFWRVLEDWLTRRTSVGRGVWLSVRSGVEVDGRTEHDIKAVHLDQRLRVDRVRETLGTKHQQLG